MNVRKKTAYLQNKNKFIFKVILFIALYLLLSYFYLYSQLKNGSLISNWDLQFHMNRFRGLSNVWTSPINFSTFNSTGIPVNIFYGWLTVYPIYFFYSISDNMIFSYNLYLYLLTVITFLVSHYSFYSIARNNISSSIFSITYTFSMYRAVCIFYRGAIGEVLGLTIYPVLFLLVYKIIVQNKNYWVSLSLVFSLLLYSHLISSLIAFFYIVLFYVIMLFSKSSFKIDSTKTLIKAGISTALLSAAYLIPMIEQIAKINPPAEVNLKDRSLSIISTVNGAISLDFLSYSIGLIPIIFMILLLFYFKKMSTSDKCIYFVCILSLIMTTSIFPWQYFQKTPINTLQFPWRLFGIASLFACYLGCKYVVLALKSSLVKKVIFLLLIVFSVSTNYISINKFLKNEQSIFINNPTLTNEDVNNMSTTMFTFDYTPKNYEHYIDQVKNHEVRLGNKSIDHKKNITDSTYFVEVIANEEQVVSLPIYNYKGVCILLNGKFVETETKDNPLVNVKINSGKNIIKVSYKYTKISKISFFLSIVWLICLLILSLKKFLVSANEKNSN